MKLIHILSFIFLVACNSSNSNGGGSTDPGTGNGPDEIKEEVTLDSKVKTNAAYFYCPELGPINLNADDELTVKEHIDYIFEHNPQISKLSIEKFQKVVEECLKPFFQS